jgi:hypothetical protein
MVKTRACVWGILCREATGRYRETYASFAETEREWVGWVPAGPGNLLKIQSGPQGWKTWGISNRISDAHEWINEIPTVPIYYLAKPQPRERAWNNQRGKKTLLSLTLV